jgi:ABC-type oligopeptide transport system ATPase subunit
MNINLEQRETLIRADRLKVTFRSARLCPFFKKIVTNALDGISFTLKHGDDYMSIDLKKSYI